MLFDNAGNTFSAAREINTAAGWQTISDRIDTLDPNDYYRFSLSNRSSLQLSLNNLTADANLKLLTSNGTVLQDSLNQSLNAKNISTVLDPGTYYIQVYQGNSNVATDYNLSFVPQGSAQKTDLLWRDYNGGANAIWFMGGSSNTSMTSATALQTVPINWTLEANGDFNGDGRPDLLWRNYSTGENVVWFMGASNSILASRYLPSAPTDWKLEDTRDINGDSRPDLLWRNYTTGASVIWFMGGSSNTVISSFNFLPTVSTNWRLEGATDFNCDGKSDLLWRDYGSGTNVVWFMGGTNNTSIASSTYLTNVPSNWKLEGAADFNGDGKSDLLWRDYGSGTNVVWFMGGTNNATISSCSYLPSVAGNWRPVIQTRPATPDSAPGDLQFTLSNPTLAPTDSLSVTNGSVWDGDGANDIAQVNFRIQKNDGTFVSVNGVSSFTASGNTAGFTQILHLSQ
jgi:hypothetical protein